MASVSRFLTQKLRLKVNEAKSAVAQTEERKFLGFSLRFQLNYGKAYNGDSKALLTATYKGEYYPSQEQLYAAKLMLDREYPPDVPGEYEVNEQGRVVLFLPHNRRDPLGLHDNDPDQDRILAELDRVARRNHLQRDEKLREWIAEGKLCEGCAILARSQWKEDDDPEWERMTPVKPPVQYIPAPMQPRLDSLAPVANTAPANG
jgi:hypothetical protein